jgi:hypothetical protein
MLKLIGALAVVSVLALAPGRAAYAQSSNAKTCFENCRVELKRAGTWDSYPRGYCRRKCGYWAGAPADAQR